MIDREKVVKGLEYCTGNQLCSGCGYYDPDNVRCQKDLMRDALELLKEQEPVTPKEVSMYHKINMLAVAAAMFQSEPKTIMQNSARRVDGR